MSLEREKLSGLRPFAATVASTPTCRSFANSIKGLSASRKTSRPAARRSDKSTVPVSMIQVNRKGVHLQAKNRSAYASNAFWSPSPGPGNSTT
ncbi:hypothetical protein B0T14DRAFT_334637 [Immersiella caudata]|uniref:Uncharacterized protein n=1 Tax=Immersiella caudata TaxID=314043 RepID=A0AA39U647_9PEZI|nr:hypothetical protein B0T14DRAFT_334637 [Immersiella caudata]